MTSDVSSVILTKTTSAKQYTSTATSAETPSVTTDSTNTSASSTPARSTARSTPVYTSSSSSVSSFTHQSSSKFFFSILHRIYKVSSSLTTFTCVLTCLKYKNCILTSCYIWGAAVADWLSSWLAT